MTNEPNSTPGFTFNSLAELETPPPFPRLKPREDLRSWAKRLLVCNPFFLCSAALLLFAINRLSIDPNFLANETHNLLFNFSALQFYEVLLVATAIVLARRSVWYDSALLAVLENGLVLVPFMLLSQAALIGKGIAWALTLSGGAIAICRFLTLRRLYPRFNLPREALLLGGVVLVANVALPRFFRPWIELDVADWEMPNLWAWYLALPFLAAGANLLPRPTVYGGNHAERPWLPLFIFTLWIAGSAVHVWSLMHICGLPFKLELIAPVALVCAWTFYNRLPDFTPVPTLALRNALLVGTFILPVLAYENSHVFFPLCATNFVGFCVLWMRGRIPVIARELALVSIPLLLTGMPAEWGRGVLFDLNRTGWLPAMSRPELVLLAALAYCAISCLRLRSVKAAMLGVMSIFCVAAILRPNGPGGVPLQIALVYLLLHSMRWEEKTSVEIGRYCVGALWVVHSFLWTWDGILREGMVVAGGALLISLLWLLRWRLMMERGPVVYVIAASLSLLCPPLNWFKNQNSEGIIALVASFVLFGIGFILAWTKHHWHGKEKMELGSS